jgi:hypothetical protein
MVEAFVKSSVIALLFASSNLLCLGIANAQPIPIPSIPGETLPRRHFKDSLLELPYETSRYTLICSRAREGNVGPARGDSKQEFIVQEYFRTNKTLPDAAQASWQGVNGVGVRVVIEIHSLEGRLNLGFLSSLIGIGAAAEAKKIYGTISIEVVGIGGRVITNVIPVPTELSQKSIADALQAINAIKLRITEPNNNLEEIYVQPSPIDSPKLQSLCGKE